MNPTYYEILNLSPSALASLEDEAAAASLIKRAYRRALLSHHPDKNKPITTLSSSSLMSSPPLSAVYTVDQISAAYATLSRPTLRQAYDRSLLALRSQPSSLLTSSSSSLPGTASGGTAAADFQTGIETVDLDDLDYEEEGQGRDSQTTWYRPCRCGNSRGYHFGEADLEDAADLGELMVGCADCSLWLRVCFAVLEDDDGEEERDEDRDQHTGKENGDGIKVAVNGSDEVRAGESHGP